MSSFLMFIQVFLEHGTIPSLLSGIVVASKLHHMSFCLTKLRLEEYYDGDFFKMRQSVGGDIFRVCKGCSHHAGIPPKPIAWEQ